jgi:hypothetical protein
MDNEHSIWFSTHQDIHPVGPTGQEILNDMINYGGMVKSNDPNAIVSGPEEWGWGGYFYSGYDQQNSGNHDRSTNGGMDYCPWLLQQLHQHAEHRDAHAGLFTLHDYPQAGEFGNDVSTSMGAAQYLTDSSGTDLCWQAGSALWAAQQYLNLIPRMKNGWRRIIRQDQHHGIQRGAEDSSAARRLSGSFGIFGRGWTWPHGRQIPARPL